MIDDKATLGIADSGLSCLFTAIARRDDVLLHTITSPLLVPYQRNPRRHDIVGTMHRR